MVEPSVDKRGGHSSLVAAPARASHPCTGQPYAVRPRGPTYFALIRTCGFGGW